MLKQRSHKTKIKSRNPAYSFQNGYSSKWAGSRGSCLFHGDFKEIPSAAGNEVRMASNGFYKKNAMQKDLVQGFSVGSILTFLIKNYL